MLISSHSLSVLLPIWRPDYRFSDVDWLCQAISSVAMQRPAVSEIIVFVDGAGSLAFWSATKAQLSEQSLAACRLVVSPSNIGLSRALNWSLAESRGGLVARIDQDDVWKDRKLLLQCAALEADRDLALSFTGMDWTDAQGRLMDKFPRGMSWSQTIAFCQHVGCPIPHPSIVARRDVLLALGGYPESPLTYACEDFLLWSTLVRFFRAEGLPDCLVQYRQHPASMSASRHDTQAAATAVIMADLKRLGSSADYVNAFDACAKALGKRHSQLGLDLLELWQFGGETRVPTGLMPHIDTIFYDRCVNIFNRAADHVDISISRL